MRIGDVTALERARVQNGKLFLYTQKTGTPVYLPLPDFVLEALEKTPAVSERYFFWSGNGKLKSAVADWQRILTKVYETAGGRTHTPTGFETLLRWNFYCLEYLWSGCPFCSAT